MGLFGKKKKDKRDTFDGGFVKDFDEGRKEAARPWWERKPGEATGSVSPVTPKRDTDRDHWWDDYDSITYDSDGKGDYYDEMYGEMDRRDSELGGTVLSSMWSYGRSKKEDAEAIIHDLMEIRNSVASIVRIHGVPLRTKIEIATLGQQGAGSAGFDDIGTWKEPHIFLDKAVYDCCNSSNMLDVYCGVGLHEASHLNHTRKMFIRMRDGELDGMRKMWEGLFEDERIEEKVREESPGYGPYLQAVKRSLFEDQEFGQCFEKWDTACDLDKVNMLIFGFIRCPHLMKDEHKEWKTLRGLVVHEKLRSIFPKIPETEDEVEEYGKRLMELWDEIRKEYTEDIGKGSEEFIKEAESDGEKLPKKEKNEIHTRILKQKKADAEDKRLEEKTESLKKAAKEIADALKGIAADAEAISEAEKRKDLKTEEKKDEKRKGYEEKIEKAEEVRKGRRFGIPELLKMMERIEVTAKPLDIEETKEMAKVSEERLEFGDSWRSGEDYHDGKDRRTLIIHPKKTPEIVARHAEFSASVRGHIARMRSVFRLRLGTKMFTETERVEGKLHRRMIARAPLTPRIFKRSYSKKDQGIALCLVLDESGSMGHASISGRRSWGGANKATTALQVSTLIAEALKGLPGIELEVYSYASCGKSDGDCLIKYLYGKNNPHIETLAGFEFGHQNYDHIAFKTCGDLFIKNTVNTNRLMIILNDGQPAGLHYGGHWAIEQTRKAVEALEKRAIHVLNVAIEDFDSHSMFKNTIKFLDLNDLINRMRRLIVQIVKQTTEAR